MFSNDSTNEDRPSSKVCTRCGVDKPLTEYHRDKKRKDGLRGDCKDCHRIAHRISLQKRDDKTLTAPEEKACNTCGEIRPISEYFRNPGGKDGYFAACKRCVNERRRERRGPKVEREKKYKTTRSWYEEYGGREYMREYSAREDVREAKRKYNQSEQGKATRKLRSARYYQENKLKFAARGAVNRAVKLGKIPRAVDCVCVDCGEPAVEYHHYLGYERDHWFDIKSLCKLCHAKTYTIPHE